MTQPPHLVLRGIVITTLTGLSGAAILIVAMNWQSFTSPSLHSQPLIVIPIFFIVAILLTPQLILSGVALGWLARVSWHLFQRPDWVVISNGIGFALLIPTIGVFSIAVFIYRNPNFIQNFMRWDNRDFQYYLLALLIATLGGALTGWLLTRR